MAIEHQHQIAGSHEEGSAEATDKLERLLSRHREEAARLRDQFGDTEASFAAFVRHAYDQESLAEVFRDLLEGGGIWDGNSTDERKGGCSLFSLSLHPTARRAGH